MPRKIEDVLKEKKISEIVNPVLIQSHPDLKIREAVELMQKEKCGEDVETKMIVNKYKGTEYVKGLNELMDISIHKLRNSLAAISLAAEILRKRVEKKESNDKYFEMIFKEIDSLECTAKNLFKTVSDK